MFPPDIRIYKYFQVLRIKVWSNSKEFLKNIFCKISLLKSQNFTIEKCYCCCFSSYEHASLKSTFTSLPLSLRIESLEESWDGGETNCCQLARYTYIHTYKLLSLSHVILVRNIGNRAELKENCHSRCVWVIVFVER